eukprot:XP_014790482.1 PREDICTED: uncharacterized protein LOC106883858 [Octopus bimaculoides]
MNKQHALLQQDIVRPHIARTTRKNLQELEGIELKLHPEYNPDLTPRKLDAVYLFRSMAYILRSRRFINQEGLEASEKEFFASKDKKWYHYGIKRMDGRWFKTVQHNCFYFQCWAAFVVTW